MPGGFRKRDFKFGEGKLFGNKVAEMFDSEEKIELFNEIVTGVVLEVVSNPYEFLSKKNGNTELREILSRRYKGEDSLSAEIKNKEIVDFIPMNSILVKLIENKVGNTIRTPVLCLPFFSSHFSLPIKPGEYVWILKEVVKGAETYYWMSRKHGYLQNEDVNFTSAERINPIANIYNNFYANRQTITPGSDSIDAVFSFKNQKINADIGIENIVKSSHAYKEEFTGEPVPRVSKSCSDFLIQGSNNAGIHITTEKFSANTEPGNFANSSILEKRKPNSGVIDIFVNRKFEDINNNLAPSSNTVSGEKLNIIKNTFSDSGYEYYENNKISDISTGDVTASSNEIKDAAGDAIDVSARLYLTANSNFDSVFQNNFDVLSEKSGSAAILFGKNTRMISQENTRITSLVGESFIDLDEEGNVVIKAAKGGAFISLRKDGSIAIVPGVNGFLYLGGEEGDAVNIPLGNRKQPGDVLIGTPIVSTMGGVIGDPSPATGNFATKVLIK